jgi:hypothetical protein
MFEPQTPDDYLDLIDQAVYEVEDLMAAAEYEELSQEDDLSAMRPVLQLLLTELKKLHAAVQSGVQPLGSGQDLPFMTLVRQWKTRLPVGGLFEAVNEVQKKGL